DRGARPDRGALPRRQPRDVQGAAVPRSGRDRRSRRDARHRAPRRSHPADAGDRDLLPDRQRGDLRAASVERLRERMADLPGPALARALRRERGDGAAAAARRRRPRAHRSARARVLRQGVRRELPRPAAQPAGRGRPRRERPRARADGHARRRVRGARCRRLPHGRADRSARAERHARRRARARAVRYLERTPRAPGDRARARVRRRPRRRRPAAPGPRVHAGRRDLGVRRDAPPHPRIHVDRVREADPSDVPRHRASGPRRRDRPPCRHAVRREHPVPRAGRAGLRALRVPRGHRDARPRRAPGPSRAERIAPDLPRVSLRRAPGDAGARAMSEAWTVAGSAIAQLVLFVALGPGVNGVVKRMKAALQGRNGPPILQPYFDLMKLLRKDTVVSEHASAITRWAPIVYASAFATAALLVPALWWPAPLGGWGDAIAIVGLFALARVALALAGLDAGSAFGGMGSSREVAVAALAEPALLLALLAVGWRTGGTDISS